MENTTIIFTGCERMTVDDKNRVGIPAKFMAIWRDRFPNQDKKVGIGLTPEHTIKLMPQPVYAKYLEQLNRLDESIEDERILKHYMLMFSEEAELDNQNRLKFGDHYRDECAIVRAVMICGAGEYLLVFDELQWREYCRVNRPRLSAAAGSAARREEHRPLLAHATDAAGEASTVGMTAR